MIPTIGSLIDGPSGKATLKIEEPIGQGAFGTVFAAQDISTNIKRAVKFPTVNFFQDSDSKNAFLNEVQAASKIKHPNVVEVVFVNSDETQGAPYLVMEMLPDGSLAAFLNSRIKNGQQIDFAVLQSWFSHLVDGIEAINEKMLHRDLHPGNILLNGSTLKIGDFGLAKLIAESTRTNTFKGRQHILYMAPEAWMQQKNDIGIDMYSLGIILFQLATLSYPFEIPEDSSNFELFRKMHLFGVPKTISSLRPELPPGIQQVTLKLLSKRRSERFAKWAEVRNALAAGWASVALPSNRTNALMTEIVQQNTRLHMKETEAQLKAEKVAAQRAEQNAIDIHQKDELIKELIDLVEQYNTANALDKVKFSPNHSGDYVLETKRAGNYIFRFFTLPRRIRVRNGFVRYVGVVDGPRRLGFNLLLVRDTEDEPYGHWSVCRVKTSPLAGASVRHAEPFGFATPYEVLEIERASAMMHIYVVTFDDWSPNAILELINAQLSSQK